MNLDRLGCSPVRDAAACRWGGRAPTARSGKAFRCWSGSIRSEVRRVLRDPSKSNQIQVNRTKSDQIRPVRAFGPITDPQGLETRRPRRSRSKIREKAMRQRTRLPQEVDSAFSAASAFPLPCPGFNRCRSRSREIGPRIVGQNPTSSDQIQVDPTRSGHRQPPADCADGRGWRLDRRKNLDSGLPAPQRIQPRPGKSDQIQVNRTKSDQIRVDPTHSHLPWTTQCTRMAK